MTKKIRVAQITHDLSLGGLQQVIVNLCKSMDKELFDVSVLCLRARGVLADEIERMGIEVTLLPQRVHGTDYFSFIKVASYLKNNKIDVIHTHNTQPFIDGTLAAQVARIKSIIHTDHARIFPDKKRYMVAEWVMSHFADKVVGVSEATSDNLVTYEKIPRKKVATIANGVDGAAYRVSIDKAQKRSELGIREEGPVLGLGARLVKEKGLDVLMEAMGRVVELFPDVSLVIAGGGPLEDFLRLEIESQGLGAHVFLVGPRHDMPELLNLFDVYLLPSISEGLPMGLLEAMAAKCPVLASRVGGIPRVISHGVNGRLVEPGHPGALAKEIGLLLSDDALRREYAGRALVTFNEAYHARFMTQKYESLYLESVHAVAIA